MDCPYKKECATTIYWQKVKAGFIKEVCDTDEYENCTHYAFSLKPQHDERERLYGNPHAHEPDWEEVAKRDGR